MIQVELSKIIIDEKRQDQVIVLRESDGERQIPIVIGISEASSIKMALAEVEAERPMTHDLIVSLIVQLDADFQSLIIDDLAANTFHSKLEIVDSDGEAFHIDARPSDGIAIALRFQAPIFVEEDVLEKATKLDF